MIINSIQNPKIKNTIKLLQKNSVRMKQGLFVVDGSREVKEVVKAGMKIETLFFCPELVTKKITGVEKNKIIEVSIDVFSKMSYKENPDGYLAVVKRQEFKLKDIKLKTTPLVVVLESVEKPGNLGALIRTAYAVDVDVVILNDNQTDIYNPNVIRASEGKLFSVPVVISSRENTLEWLKDNSVQLFAAATSAKKIYSDCKFNKAMALILGSESRGLSDQWLKEADENIKIPMKQDLDSLNVSVSAAVILFEIIRQRRKD